MDYEVRKWLDSGGVEFRIHAFSRPAHIPNLVIRLGFRVFGRQVQRRFARHACLRWPPPPGPCRRPQRRTLRRQARNLAVSSKPLCRNDFGQPRSRCLRGRARV